MPQDMRRSSDHARVTIGLLIVALGVALLLDRAGVIDVWNQIVPHRPRAPEKVE